MRSLENNWQEPLSHRLIDAVVHSTRNTEPYTNTWKNMARQAAVISVETSNFDAEDLRQNIYTIRQQGEVLGCAYTPFTEALKELEPVAGLNPHYKSLLNAINTDREDLRGLHHFGDAQTYLDTDRAEAITGEELAKRVSWSNACTTASEYYKNVMETELVLPSLQYQPMLIPELSQIFDTLSLPLQSYIWDYVRCNKTWQYMVDNMTTENPKLFFEIMHKREIFTTPQANIESLPPTTSGNISMRFIGLAHPYPVIPEIWDRFDKLIQARHYEMAEIVFDQDIQKLTELIPRVSSAAELTKAFLYEHTK